MRRLAIQFEMNILLARKLIEMASAEPAIIRLSRKYDRLKEDDSDGEEISKECC